MSSADPPRPRIARRFGLLAGVASASVGLLGAAITLRLGATPVALALLATVVAAAIAAVTLAADRLLASRLAALARRLPAPAAAAGGDEIDRLGAAVDALLAHAAAVESAAAESARAGERASSALGHELTEKTRVLQEQSRRTEARARELELMLAATEAAGSRLDLGGVLRVLVEKAGRALGVDAFAILLRDDDGAFSARATWGFADADAVEALRLPPDDALTSEVIRVGEPVIIDDSARDGRVTGARALFPDGASFVAVPIHDPLPLGPAPDGPPAPVGIFPAWRRRGATFREADVRLLVQLARHTAVAIASAGLLARLERERVVDDVTGLVNRRLLDARGALELKRVAATRGRLAVIAVGLGRLDAINEARGIQAGDAVLRRVAGAVASTTRGSDVVARWAGARLVALLPDRDRAAATAHADRIRESVAALGDPEARVAVGVACWPEDGTDLSALVEAADASLRAASRSTTAI